MTFEVSGFQINVRNQVAMRSPRISDYSSSRLEQIVGQSSQQKFTSQVHKVFKEYKAMKGQSKQYRETKLGIKDLKTIEEGVVTAMADYMSHEQVRKLHD